MFFYIPRVIRDPLTNATVYTNKGMQTRKLHGEGDGGKTAVTAGIPQ